ncbi:MAG TPA: glycosyltransferase [Marmoricola sp.]|nr:glycosyltransferase [Marmoricola sp.]
MTGGRVTVVVMTRNRWPDLRRTLDRHEPPVVLVDNGSDDGTPDLVRQHFPHVEVVALGENRGAVARNLGVERSRTPYVAFADDDSWWEPEALGHAADLFDRHPRLAVLAARVLVGEERRLDPVAEHMATAPLGTDADLPGPSVLGFVACGAVVRRDAFLDVGGFDDVVFFMGEEERVVLDLAAGGWGLAYVDSVVARHVPVASGDRAGRPSRVDRNRLLTAVMRRPWSVVAEATRSALRTPTGRRGLLSALPSLPAAYSRRALVPADVEQRCRLARS